MPIRKTWPEPVSRWPSGDSRTQPVPSMAACRDGSASTSNTVSADVLIVVVALTVSSGMATVLRFLWFAVVPHDVDDAAKQNHRPSARGPLARLGLLLDGLVDRLEGALDA